MLTCVKATKCKDNTDAVATLLKLVADNSVKDTFGETAGKSTYYRFVKGDANKMLNKQGEVDLDQFDAVSKERTFAGEDGEEITRTLTYLYAKRV